MSSNEESKPDGVRQHEHNDLRGRYFAEAIVDTIREGLLVLTPDLHIEAANAAFYQMFRVNDADTQGKRIYDLDNGQWDISELRELLEDILPTDSTVEAYEITQQFEDLGERTLLLNARRLNHLNLILLAIEDITTRKKAEMILRDHNQALQKGIEERVREVRELAARLTHAEQAERERIAQVLHDDIQQRLYAIHTTHVSALTDLRDNTHVAEEQVQELERASDWMLSTIQVCRRLSVDLNPPVLRTEGLAHALTWLASQMKSLHDLDVELDARHDAAGLRWEMRLLTFQLVRELLFNIAKHAGVKRAWVTLREDGSNAYVDVKDEGRGFTLTPKMLTGQSSEASFGLASVQQRLHNLGGEMIVNSAPGHGTNITLRVPISEKPKKAGSG